MANVIDSAEMQHLMNLARLELAPSEAESVRADLNKILGYFEQLQSVDTQGVEEMQRPVALSNVMRDDVPGEMLSVDELRALAPSMDSGFVKVPRTVEAD